MWWKYKYKSCMCVWECAKKNIYHFTLKIFNICNEFRKPGSLCENKKMTTSWLCVPSPIQSTWIEQSALGLHDNGELQIMIRNFEILYGNSHRGNIIIYLYTHVYPRAHQAILPTTVFTVVQFSLFIIYLMALGMNFNDDFSV